MKMKLGLGVVVFSLATIVGCASPTDRLCEENQKCEGAADPAGECADLKAECDEDEECAEGREKCQAEGDAVSQCILDSNPTCQDVGDASFFLPEDEDACADELEALIECQS